MSKPEPLVLVFKELSEADLLKLQAISNISDSGGGARDLRLPWKTFRPVMQRIFDKTGVGRGGKPIRYADVNYTDEGQLKTTRLEYWPPTEARRAEDRVSKVHASPALGGRLPQTDKGRIFVLFIKWDNGETRVYYAYEDELRTPKKWAPEVRAAILGCMQTTDDKNAKRKGSFVTVQGYIDFVNGSTFCHAD